MLHELVGTNAAEVAVDAVASDTDDLSSGGGRVRKCCISSSVILPFATVSRLPHPEALLKPPKTVAPKNVLEAPLDSPYRPMSVPQTASQRDKDRPSLASHNASCDLASSDKAHQ